MRFLSSLFLLLSVGTVLVAQDSGWAISASFAPQLRKRVPPLNALREIDPRDIPLSQRPSLIDTITVDGTERVFTPTGNLYLKPTRSNTWYGASLQVRRMLGNGFDFSAGLFYNQASHSGRADGPLTERSVVNRRGAIMYSVFETTDRTLGGTMQASYHLFPEKKLHPYFGMGLTVAQRKTERSFQWQVYDGVSVVVEDVPRLNTIPLSTNLTRFDFIGVAGLLYRLAPHWSLGVDFNTISGVGHGPFGLQLRWHI